MERLKHNLWQLLISVDQLFNVFVALVTFRKAWADMTLSAMAWHWNITGKRRWVYRCIDTLFFFDKDHCRESYRNECERTQTPLEIREK